MTCVFGVLRRFISNSKKRALDNDKVDYQISRGMTMISLYFIDEQYRFLWYTDADSVGDVNSEDSYHDTW